MSVYNFISLFGIIGLLALGWVFSAHRRIMNWRLILWGCGIQVAFAALIFVLPQTEVALKWFNEAFNRLLECAHSGIDFAFGPLAAGPGIEGSVGFILAVQGLLMIVFFGALMSLLYYYRVMDRLIYAFSWLFTRLMRVSGAESLCVSANIFVGIEAYLTVRPYVAKMTRSELYTILTAGMATIASSVMGLYVLILRQQIPDIAGHLMSATIISAPAAIVLSKIILPEIERPVTLGQTVEIADDQPPNNAVEAIINGAMQGMTMAINITALLIAFIGLMALVNLLLSIPGNAIQGWLGIPFPTSVQELLGYLFYPITLMMGIQPDDAFQAAKLLGERLVLTEVPAYQKLAELSAQGALHPRTAMILSYALCGFAHVPSVAIFVGGAVTIAPERKKELSELGLKALFAATLACCLTGAVAGLFYH